MVLTGNVRATYSHGDAWSVVEILKRVPNVFHMSLGPTDGANLTSLLITVETTNFCGQAAWAADLRDTLHSQNRRDMWPRATIVNLIGLLYVVQLDGHHKGFGAQMCDWSHDFYTSIAESLDVELI
jgi:hypothetical protein